MATAMLIRVKGKNLQYCGHKCGSMFPLPNINVLWQPMGHLKRLNLNLSDIADVRAEQSCHENIFAKKVAKVSQKDNFRISSHFRANRPKESQKILRMCETNCRANSTGRQMKVGWW